MPKKISVIIPFYNRIRYLPEAIESVFNQTTDNIELILVDDGSTDNSLEHAHKHWENLCTRSPNMQQATRTLVSMRIPHSAMPGLVRNRGVGVASASFIAFLDSDDLWLPQKLAKQMSLHTTFRISHTRERWLRANDLALTPNYYEHDMFSFKEISQKGQRHRRVGNIFQDALWKCIIGPSTVLMEKALFEELGGFREDLRIAEDYEFWLRVTSQLEIGYVDEPLVEKRAGMPLQDQLSERYNYIELFRVCALNDMLTQGRILNAQQKEHARKVLEDKVGIVQKGASKRGCIMKEMSDVIQYCEEKVRGGNEK